MDPGLPIERMLLVLSPSDEQEHQLRTLLDSQQTKGSPDYHQWLTPEAFGQRFGPSPQDIQQVTGWLEQQGFSVASIAKSGRWIEFSGTAGQVQTAFHTQMRNYQVEGKMHFANASDISIPAALSQVVRGVSLHNFFSKPMHQRLGTARRTQDGRYVRVNPDGTFNGGTVHALAPGDFAIIYNLTPLYAASLNGSGQTIALVGRSNIDPIDINDFHTNFGPTGPINVILNGPDPGLVPGDQDEATLDVEWSSGVAPGATIDLVVSAIVESSGTDGVDLSAAFIVDNNFAQVMSTSFGQCEKTMGVAENAFWNNLWEQAAAQGISAMVSAGDSGAAGCDDPNSTLATGGAAVSGLASTPFNTAVGGTEFDESLAPGGDATFWNTANSPTFVSVKGYIPEMVWNESCSVASCGAANANLFAGSGGTSTIYATPSWQSATGIPGLNFTNRAIPDVSLAAAGGHDGFLTCDTGSCEQHSFAVFGGTSVSSPSFAGIMAIVDQKIGKRQGLANYVLYALAKNETFGNCNSANRINPATPNPAACVFNDTTTGNNTVPGQVGSSAVAGYDLATGLGSVDANNLVNAWATLAGGFQGSQTNLTVTSPALVAGTLQITHGQAVAVTATVQKVGGAAGPTGNVAIETSAPGSGSLGQITLGAGPLVSGSFSGTFSNFPGGSYTLSAHYPGDGVFGASDGPNTPIPVVVTPENSTTTVKVSPASIPYGGLFDLSTVVSSSANTSPPDAFPSGTINIKDNGTSIGTLALNGNGQAELFNCSTPVSTPTSVPCLTVGSHPIQILYSGDAGFNASNTAPAAVTITVGKAASTGTVTAPASAQSGAPISVSATVNAAGPIFATGTVQFFQGTTSLGAPVTLTAGNPSTASTQVTLSGSGSQMVTAQYSGDSTYGSATLGPATVVLTTPFTFTAVATSQTIAAGQNATFNLTLNNTNFNGAINFTCTGAPTGANCAVSPNPANLTPATATVPLTVTVSNTTNARLKPAPFKTMPFVFAAAIVGLLVGVRKKPRKAVLAVLAFALVVGVGSCGGGGNPTIVMKQPTVANLTVTGSNGALSTSINLTLTITH
jgi:hypothetical protein